MIVFHSRNGLEVLEHSRRLYSARYHLPLMGFCTLHLCDALIRYSPNQPPATDVVRFCLDTLRESRAGFSISAPLQELFRRTAVDLKIPLPDNYEELMDPEATYGIDDILDACGRLTYGQPTDQIIRHMDPDIGTTWPEEWRLVTSSTASHNRPQLGNDSRRTMQINTLLND